MSADVLALWELAKVAQCLQSIIVVVPRTDPSALLPLTFPPSLHLFNNKINILSFSKAHPLPSAAKAELK
jgi:hypothetical protein